MDLPPLSESERAGLVESIRQDGIKYPVLLDSTGAVIDGHNRLAIAAELGIDCPTLLVDADEATVARLRISLNVDRRQLTQNYRQKLILELRALDISEREIAETLGISKTTVHRDIAGGPGGPPANKSVKGRDGKSYPASRENYHKRRKEIAARKAAAAAREKERRRVEKNVRQINGVTNTNAMTNAPAGKLNLPGLRKGRQIRRDLIELSRAVPPDRFVSQLPVEACREFTVDAIAWWAEVATLASERLALEGADLPPLPESQRA